MKLAFLIATLGVLVTCVILIYGSDLSIVFANSLVFTSGNAGNYVIAIPPLVAFVIYRKRQVLTAVMTRDDGKRWFSAPAGISLILVAATLYLYGSATLYAPDYHLYSMILFICGAILLLYNLATLRHAFFAIVLLAFLQPPPGELIGGAAADISWVSALLLDSIFKIASFTANLDTNLGAPSFIISKPDGEQNTFVIGEPSSGVFSTIGISVFALFVSYISGGKIWKRLALYAISFPLFFILNTLRIGTIMLLWYLFNNDTAELFHLVGGVMMVTIGTILLLILGEKIFKIPYLRPRIRLARCQYCQASLEANEDFCLMCGRSVRPATAKIRKATAGAIMALLVVSSIVFAANYTSSTVQSSKGIESLDIKSVQGPETLQYVLPAINGNAPVFAYRDKSTESVLNQDLALAFRYEARASNDTSFTNSLAYVGIQISNGRHTWEDSLISYPSSVGRPSAKVIELKDIKISPDTPARFFMYQRSHSNSTEAVIYWFERMPFKFGSHYENRNVFIVIWLYTDNLAQQHLIASPLDVQGTENYLLQFANPISDYWSGIRSHAVTFTFLNDFMLRNYSLFLALIIGPTALFIGYRASKEFALQKHYRKLFAKLVRPEERSVIVAAATCRKSPVIGDAVAEEYNRRDATSSIKPDEFISILKRGREAGFLNNMIDARNDIPIMVWRPRVGRAFGRLKLPEGLFGVDKSPRQDGTSATAENDKTGIS